MKKYISTLFLLIGTLVLFAQEINIVPKPTSVNFENGDFVIKETLGYQIYGIQIDSIKIGLEQLKEEFQNNFNIDITEKKQPKIFIGIADNDVQFEKICLKNNLLENDDLGNQGYELKISSKQIIIAANSSQGLFYGIQSLKQIIRGAENRQLKCMIIHDVPAFKYRGVMDDISRGPVPSPEFLKYQIRRASELKINLFTYYIEHVVETEKHPEFAPANGAISIEEWTKLSEYASNYHIQLVGSFQSLGHFEKILSHPKFSHLGATSRMLNPGTPESLAFLNDIYSEMAPAFSSPFFNIHCDETWDLGRGKTKALADSIGISRLYSNHINGISELLTKQNKTMLMWGDITLSHPEIFNQIPKKTILLTWEYGDLDSFADFIDPIKNSGFDFMVCPGVLNSNRLYPDMNMAVNNIRKFIAEGCQKGAIGVLNTVWDDGGRPSFNRDWYGIAYGADQSWNPGNRTITDFDQCFSKGVYGDYSLALPKTIHKLMELTEISATQELNSQIFWNTIIPERGESISFKMNDWQTVFEISEKADSILQTNQLKNYSDELQYTSFVISQYKYLAEVRMKLLIAANKYSEASTIQFENRVESEKLLSETLVLVQECQKQFATITNNFEKLWKLENREYWLNYATDPYKNILLDYSDLENSLNDAITIFKQNKSIPYPKDIRLDIKETEGNYFQYWLLCGPFPIKNEIGPLPDFLETMGGEAGARPIPGFSFKTEDNVEFFWTKYASPVNSQINLKTIYEKNTTVVSYAYCTIESDKTQKVTATFGSNDGIKIYCNGEETFSVREKRDLIIDENSCILNLQPGKNHILLKVDNWKGGWGFSFRLPKQKIRHHKHKYKIIGNELNIL
ncbi:MAG: family 20 glycosylhydrolase [Prolixibacteraceae bacterium]|nr:family 20 glycosylhydrolase [Prolixibacteraceae bacterium]MBT6766117.1 family 20 glycosylhydrolase [Prolixibacteraceae bacterium]MBT7000797.1 family 20 glycosylhydrolase [Prolixibacteraceae bacterium]MBT7393566.1 family 20 glycosylhydrolase [Prolixibacteraceae bacterium]